MSDKEKKDLELPEMDDFDESDAENLDYEDENFDDLLYGGPDEMVAACMTIACELNKIRRKHHDDDKALEEVKKTFDYVMEKMGEATEE
ncbi:MAG: hypothetical protein ABIE74_04695 [Pseudomonadota bacterium]